ncbi:DedA family protein [Pseudomonas sp. MAP12]|uniref:DedA family protein n=1 Tax=Geopseudomonas aromaticivorans TaxID=2849492 RepID=A0ABS6MY99_9GAMM|nr:YqaA family protein [Pseudomonas aromaticivorans]MBV2133775.1 DedA family protein [Pseudomonas aromaticivorans]
MLDLSAYLGLFFAAFGAASLLPLQSEALLVGLLLAERQPVLTLLAVATAGNVLGSLLNWLLGLYLERFREKRWFPVRERHLQRARHWYQRFGRWSLLFSWLPVVGDPLTLVAGVMRESFWVVLACVTLAKGIRYAVLTALTLGLA